jgi:hypothetical protein
VKSEVSANVEGAVEFQPVEFDEFIQQEVDSSERMDGRRILKMAEPVSFVARMKRFPEAKQMSYIYTALEMAEVSPLPDVGHQMFVESKQGRIISVYVERQVALRLASDLKEGEAAEFFGYHVYSYAKGPALLVVDFVPIAESEEDVH